MAKPDKTVRNIQNSSNENLTDRFERLKQAVTIGFDNHDKQKELLEKSHNQIAQELHGLNSSIDELVKSVNEAKVSHKVTEAHLEYVRNSHKGLEEKLSIFERFRYQLCGGAVVGAAVLGYGWFSITSPIEDNKNEIADSRKSHNEAINKVGNAISEASKTHEVSIQRLGEKYNSSFEKISKNHTDSLLEVNNLHLSAISKIDDKISKINERVDRFIEIKTTGYKPLSPEFDGMIAFGVNEKLKDGCLTWGITFFDFTKQLKMTYNLSYDLDLNLPENPTNEIVSVELKKEIEKARKSFHNSMNEFHHKSFKEYTKRESVHRADDLIILPKIDLPIRLKITQLFGSPETITTIENSFGTIGEDDNALDNDIALANGYEAVIQPSHRSSCRPAPVQTEEAPAPPKFKAAPAPPQVKSETIFHFSPLPDPLFVNK